VTPPGIDPRTVRLAAQPLNHYANPDPPLCRVFTIIYLKQTTFLWYTVAVVLYLQFVLHVMLFRMLNVFCTFILALSAVCVQRPIWLFVVVPRLRAFPVCCSGIVWVILKWFQLPLLFAFTFHMCWISIKGYLCFRIFSASFLITFLSLESATSINTHVPFSLSRIMMSGLLLEMGLSVCSC
jgi:hypothetical protein